MAKFHRKSHRILIIVMLALITEIFSGCGAAVDVTRTGKKYAPLAPNEEVILYSRGNVPANAVQVGGIRIGDTGFTVGQTYDVAVERAKDQCRKLGANALEITQVYPPDGWSTSYRINAIAYRVSNIKIDSSIEKTGYTK